MKKWFFLLIAAAVLTTITACSNNKKVVKATTINIKTDPIGADITIAGKKYGKSPLGGKFADGTYVVLAEKDGYEPQWKSVTLKKGTNTDLSFKLEPLKSSVLLTTSPNIKANVIYNGNKIGQTPIVLSNLEYGKHSAELKAPGYAPAYAEWNIDSKRPHKITVRITENTGSLKIVNIRQKGAMVKINGKNYGAPPRSFRLEQGEYSVEVTAPGHAPFVQKVSLSSGKTVTVYPALTELPGKLIVNSNPSGAMVRLNGKNQGTTPIVLEGIKPGEFKLTLTKQNYDPVHVHLGVAPGKTVNITRTLRSSLGSIEFVTVPSGVTVYLDNKLLTVTQKDPKSNGYSKVISRRTHSQVYP